MNDDLGNFPKPPSLVPNFTSPANPPQENKPTEPDNASSTEAIPFEPTPDENLSEPQVPQNILAEPKDENLKKFFPELEPEITTPPVQDTATPPTNFSTPSEPVMATAAPEIKSPTSSLITIVLLLVGGIGISGSVFLYSQSANLKKQLTDITKTLEQQKTIITPSPTPTIIDIPTPTPTKEASPEATIAPTPTATPSGILAPNPDAIPLALAPQALKVGINEEPNAQLILIKVENAKDPEKVLIKYFFRKDLTTKKYFYVSINGKNESEINNNAIYVNPDNNIPSLNDLVLGNKLGIDFKQASEIAMKSYTLDRPDYVYNAQFIKSGTKTIWQITIDPTGKKYIVQIDSVTKEVLYKSPEK